MNDRSAGLLELAKRRGFFFPANESYGGVAGFYTFGPHGASLKRNIEQSWHERFVVQEGHMEIESPTVLPEAILRASGHVDTFTDMLVECPECHESIRADHLIEDNIDIEEAESLPCPDVERLITEYDLGCPECGTSLAEIPVTDFNLMMETSIGPGDGTPGYLRPETAQGIFVEFPQLAEYARGQLPFGVAQMGSGYRNEISPRKGLVRTREFMMAELQQFFDPDEEGPELDPIADTVLRLFPQQAQKRGDVKYLERTVEQAVEENLIETRWLAYYLGIVREWFESVGMDPNQIRFRQHLPDERAHYASDCWDAEALINDDWIEIAGLAYRGEYDLSNHHEHSSADYTVFTEYDEPISVERTEVIPDMSYFGPEYRANADDVVNELRTLADRNPEAFDGDTVTVEVDDERCRIPTKHINLEVVEETVRGERMIPHVLEPSIGIGRVVSAVMHHAYTVDEVDGKPRTCLRLPPNVSPISVAVLPLTNQPEFETVAKKIVTRLQGHGLVTDYDESGTIGRRYRRQDEIGTPYCVTVDQSPSEGDTATIRERDSTDQVRVAIEEMPATITALTEGGMTFGELIDDPR
jgi:glycyl-tRNA synthetase